MSLSGAPAQQLRENIMSRVWESSSAILGAISSKIQGLRKDSSLKPEISDRRAVKQLDSAKISLRLLAAEDNFARISAVAERTDDSELASFAVSVLVESDSESVLPDLEHLARGSSLAALPALISLFNLGEVECAEAILHEKLANNDYFSLLEKRKVRAFLLLDVLGALDDFNKSELCIEYFPKIWRRLSERPAEQEALLGEILGDFNPGGIRYTPDKNMIPQCVKIKALQLLYALRPDSYERSLWYASRDEDDWVAHAATMACIDHWQNEGAVPPQLERFPLLDLNLLFYLSKLASTFKWQGPPGVMELFKQLSADLEELSSLDPFKNAQRYAELSKKTETARERIVEVAEKRINSLQPIVDAVTNSLRLPHAKIRSSEVSGVAAAYLVGTGTVEFSKSTLLEDKPLTEEFMSSMLHELGHMEQDVLIIKMFADDLDLKYGQHAGKLKLLLKKYSDAIGYAPDSIFLLEVLRLRNDQRLAADERRRAERLLKAAYDNTGATQAARQITERMTRLQESLEQIESGSLDLELLACLEDERGLKSLFENGHVPAVLVAELRHSRSLVYQLSASLPGDGKSKRQAFAVAEMLQELNEEDGEVLLSSVTERLKVVIAHMLQEEWARLDKRLSEIRRDGYHEEEAYAVSDRVEVIVKALRKGWYEFIS